MFDVFVKKYITVKNIIFFIIAILFLIFVRSSLRSYFPTLENPASTDFAAFCRIKKEPGFGLGWRGSRRPPAAERTPSEPRKSEKMRTFENLKKRGPAN